jgi:hypothetical protein
LVALAELAAGHRTGHCAHKGLLLFGQARTEFPST